MYTKQQLQAELDRRKNTALVAQEVIKKPKASVGGLMYNFAKGAGYYAKGLVGLGLQPIIHPIKTASTVAGVSSGLIKGIPKAIPAVAKSIVDLPKNAPKAYKSLNQLRKMPLEKQKELLAMDIERISKSKKAKENPNLAKLAKIGYGLMGSYSQYSRPKEKIYDDPFSALLDILPVAKATKLTNLTGKGVSRIGETKTILPIKNAITEAFVPLGGLKSKGYSDVADSLIKQNDNLARMREGTIKATIKKFKGYSTKEKRDFFDIMNIGRRDNKYIPISNNPKIQKMIDWYMKEELPRISKITGIEKQRSLVKDSLSKKIAKMQEERLQLALKPGETPVAPKLVSGVEFKAKHTKYSQDALLRNIIEELRYKTRGKASTSSRISDARKNIASIKTDFAKKIAKLQEKRLQLALKPGKTPVAPKLVSGVKFKAKPTKYNLNSILRSAVKELSYKSNRKAPIKPDVFVTTSGKITPAVLRGRQVRNFINDQFGIKKAKGLPLDRKIKDADLSRKIAELQKKEQLLVSKGVAKGLGGKRSMRPLLAPDVPARTSGRITPAILRGKKVRNFINDQFGIKNRKELPLDRKISKADKILQDYKDNPAGLKNYIHHYFVPSKGIYPKGDLSAPNRGFLEHSADVEGFVKDPIVSIAGVKIKAASANIKENFIKGVVNKYGIEAKNAKKLKNGKVFSETGEELIKHKEGYLPKDLSEELNKIERGEPGWLKTILYPMRAFNANWKPLATSVKPRYHLRNIIGNKYNSVIIGGNSPLTLGLKNDLAAFGQQINYHIGNQIKEGTIAGKVYSSLFKTPPNSAIINQATKDGIVGRGFFSADINDIAEVSDKVEDISKFIAKMENPALIYKIPVLKQWMKTMQKIGQGIEDNARLSLYMDRLKKGDTRVNAKKYVDKHLFDYLNGLGQADKIIKAVIPFWSWSRFNIPLQAGSLVKNPLRHFLIQQAGKPTIEQQEADNPEYKFLSQREKDMGAVKIGEENVNGKVYDKYARTQGVIPFQDLIKISDVENIGVSPAFNMIKQGIRTFIPPKNPEENLNYFGQPVEKYPGEVKRFLGQPVRGTVKNILESIPAISEFNKFIGGSYDEKTRPSLKSRALSIINPLSVTNQDREQNRYYAESDFNKTVKGQYSGGYETTLRTIVKKIIDSPDDEVLKRNLETIKQLLKEHGYEDTKIQSIIYKKIKDTLEDKEKLKYTNENKPKYTKQQIQAELDRRKNLKNNKPKYTKQQIQAELNRRKNTEQLIREKAKKTNPFYTQ